MELRLNDSVMDLCALSFEEKVLRIGKQPVVKEGNLITLNVRSQD